MTRENLRVPYILRRKYLCIINTSKDQYNCVLHPSPKPIYPTLMPTRLPSPWPPPLPLSSGTNPFAEPEPAPASTASLLHFQIHNHVPKTQYLQDPNLTLWSSLFILTF